MQAGRLDRKIDIQRATITSSESGAPIDSWVNLVARRSASYRAVKGDEGFKAPEVVAVDQVEFRIRFSASVASLTPKDRIIYPAMNAGDSPAAEIPGSSIFNILSVQEIGRREGLLILAQRRPDATS